jgi:hypothetical protein
MLDTINTGAQSNVTLFEFDGVRMSVLVTNTCIFIGSPQPNICIMIEGNMLNASLTMYCKTWQAVKHDAIGLAHLQHERIMMCD